MPPVTFDYTPISRPSGSRDREAAYRPLLRVTLRVGNGAYYDAVALADSGADACLFPLRFARFLKLDVGQLPKGLTGGVGSSRNVTYYANIEIDLGDGMTFETEVGFTEGMDRVGFGLLGQQGFFRKL